jgi:hypothetical protein
MPHLTRMAGAGMIPALLLGRPEPEGTVAAGETHHNQIIT